MTLLSFEEKTKLPAAKITFSNISTRAGRPAYVIISKINLKTIENKSEKFLYNEPKHGHTKFKITKYLNKHFLDITFRFYLLYNFSL